jgi:hypothetical protein
VAERGDGRNWGLQFRSALPIDRLRLHFKKFLTARLPGGERILFRFYDPRVFRTYMRAASAEERRPWFEGVSLYSVEGEQPGGRHVFSLIGGRLYDSAKAVAWDAQHRLGTDHDRTGSAQKRGNMLRISEQVVRQFQDSHREKLAREMADGLCRQTSRYDEGFRGFCLRTASDFIEAGFDEPASLEGAFRIARGFGWPECGRADLPMPLFDTTMPPRDRLTWCDALLRKQALA